MKSESCLLSQSIGYRARLLDKVRISKKFVVNILAKEQEIYSRRQVKEEVIPKNLADLPVIEGTIVQVALRLYLTRLKVIIHYLLEKF